MKVINKEEFEIIIQHGLVMVDFFATWCGPCKMLSPILDEVANELNGEIDIVKVDVDKDSELAQKYGIMSVPTLLIFKDGKIVKQLQGFMSKVQLLNEVNRLL